MIDKSNNFAKTTITGIASGVTEVVLDDATNFSDPASGEYNCVIWEISNYGNPADDPNKEIVRATALSGSTLTITRAQEGTIDSNHNTGGETYAIANVLTKKIIDDIRTDLSGKQASLGFTPENVTNKLTTFQATPDDTHYASEKLVKDSLDAKAPLASPTFTGTVTLPKTTEVNDTTGDHQYVLAVSELTADRTVTLPLLTGNDTFMFKDFHKASTAEINTGTEDNKYVTPKAIADSSYMKNPMTTAGDVIYGGTSGVPTRLPKGTAGQVLTMNSGATAPEWADASGGSTDLSVFGVPLTNAVIKKCFLANASSGENDIYTCPTGKRAYISKNWFVNNYDTSNSRTYHGSIKVSGTYYKIGSGGTLTQSTSTYANLNPNIILEAGESFSLNVNGNNVSVRTQVIEFDDTSSIKTVKLLSLTSGANTLYTVPENKTAIFLSVSQYLNHAQFSPYGSFGYRNNSGDTRTISLYQVPSGGSAGISNKIATFTEATDSTDVSEPLWALKAGDFIVVNTDSSAAGQIAFVTIIEK